jgi:hypothetical protein
MTALAIVLFTVLSSVSSRQGSPAWPQWGGPARNFVVEAPGLATTWPADGPRRLWRKPIGEGYSAIVMDGRTLYTIFRDGNSDVVIALDGASGDTRWQTRYEAPFLESCTERLGPVPRAAPLLSGDRVITVSAGGLMNSFDRQTGQRQWSVDVVQGKTDEVRACGFSASPLAFEDLIITTAGGQGYGVIAVHASSGKIAWHSQDFQNGYSSPLLIDLDGRPELVAFTYGTETSVRRPLRRSTSTRETWPGATAAWPDRRSSAPATSS